MHETPTIMAASYSSVAGQDYESAIAALGQHEFKTFEQFAPNMARAKRKPLLPQATITTTTDDEEDMADVKRRLVRVLMMDPDTNVPVEQALLYDSKEIFTDKIDSELFFDIPIGEILKAHNEKRVKLVDREVKDRTQYLEPARIRDLKMVVVELAKF